MRKFVAEKVTRRITRICMPYVCAYLIEGEHHAALIDNGWGYGDLRSFVEALTDLPYYVILTHGHSDHAGGSEQFDEVHLPALEVDLEKYSCSEKTRIKVMNKVLKNRVFTKEDILSQRTRPYTLYTEEDRFDLGGITLVPVHVPGHTQGIMSVIIPEEQIAIFGDACMDGTLLTQASSTSVRIHYNALRHLKEFEHLFNRVLVSHIPYEEPKEILESNILWASRILKNLDDRFPIPNKMGNTIVARNRNLSHNRLERIGNIKYTLDNIY